MTMQYDVKAEYTDSSAALLTYPVRIKGAYIVVTTAGTDPVIFYDNPAAGSGEVLLTLGTTAAGAHTVVIPGEGIKATAGVYCDLGDAASVTVFYG